MSVYGVIVAFRSELESSRVTRALLESNLIDGVVIVDNSAVATTDKPSFDDVIGDPRVHLVTPSSNLGYARGNNLGVRVARRHGAERVLVLNPDVMFDRENLAALLHAHEREGAPPIMSPRLREAVSVLDTPGFDIAVGRGLMSIRETSRHTLPTFFGAAFVADVDVFDAVGELDEDLFLYCEEISFVMRARREGIDKVFEIDPIAEFEHARGAVISPNGYSFSARSHIAYEEAARSVVIVGRKYFPKRLPLWVAVRLLFAARLAVQDRDASSAVLRGIVRGLRARLVGQSA